MLLIFVVYQICWDLNCDLQGFELLSLTVFIAVLVSRSVESVTPQL